VVENGSGCWETVPTVGILLNIPMNTCVNASVHSDTHVCMLGVTRDMSHQA